MSKTLESIHAATRKFVYLNDKLVSVSNFKWIICGQLTGWVSKEEATEYAKQVNDWAKLNSIQPRQLKIKSRYVVMFGCLPVGPMYDFGMGPQSGKGKRKLMIPFPDELRGSYNGFDTEEEAEKLAKKFRLYVADICTVEKQHRTGSTKYL